MFSWLKKKSSKGSPEEMTPEEELVGRDVEDEDETGNGEFPVEVAEYQETELSAEDDGAEEVSGGGALSQLCQVAQSGRDMFADANQMMETYRACQEISRDIESIKAKRDVELARIVAGFKLCNDLLDKTFGERAGALDKHYQALDKGLESGNNELVIAALRGISGIVTTCPMESFQKTVDKMFSTQRDDVLELDF